MGYLPPPVAEVTIEREGAHGLRDEVGRSAATMLVA